MTDLIVDRTQRRVVCAAIKAKNQIVTSARHFDLLMHDQLRRLPVEQRERLKHAEQGFIDQWGKFMSREESFEVATAAGQIRQKSGGADSKELYSEDLY